jgi:hypothetical protein
MLGRFDGDSLMGDLVAEPSVRQERGLPAMGIRTMALFWCLLFHIDRYKLFQFTVFETMGKTNILQLKSFAKN